MNLTADMFMSSCMVGDEDQEEMLGHKVALHLSNYRSSTRNCSSPFSQAAFPPRIVLNLQVPAERRSFLTPASLIC